MYPILHTNQPMPHRVQFAMDIPISEDRMCAVRSTSLLSLPGSLPSPTTAREQAGERHHRWGRRDLPTLRRMLRECLDTSVCVTFLPRSSQDSQLPRRLTPLLYPSADVFISDMPHVPRAQGHSRRKVPLPDRGHLETVVVVF
jgi:hypothetical protein